jgi:uncharacterized membrane protein
MNKIFKRLLNFFFKGVLIITPIGLTIYIIYYVITRIDRLIDFGFPGVGLMIMLLGLTLAGYLVTTFITEPIFNYFDRLLNRAPLLKLIYSSIRDLLEAFVGEEKKFNEPVLVDVEGNGIRQIGFLTQNDLSSIHLNDDVSVYFPLSYSFAGKVMIVPRSKVSPLHMKPADAMKFVVSGGVSDVH